MTTSIRTKLFLVLSGLALFFILLSSLLIGFGLEKFYISQKQASLIASSSRIAELYTNNPAEISLELERTASTLGAAILIFDPQGTIKYNSFGRMINDQPPVPVNPPDVQSPATSRFRVPPNSLQLVKNSRAIDDQTVLETQFDQLLKIDFVVLERQLANHDILIIRQPLAPVSESAIVTTQFLAFTGLLTLLAGCGWAFFFARKFAAPIRELNRIALGMARLDFSQKCTVNRSDELGQLGQSINHLSNHLDTAIAELNKKNRQLLADVAKERALDKMRKTFVSNVSHELKTPLALILGYAEGLKENIAVSEESKDFYCSVIMDEAGKMDALVKDLLNLSQLESGLFQINTTAFNLTALLRDIEKKYQSVLAEKGITLKLSVQDPLFIQADVLRAEQVFCNLLNNAIAHAKADRLIRIQAQETGDKIKVGIYNSGFPIPADSLEKIWTSFYKVDEARSREAGGYGLGLSIVRAIQEQHGNGYGVENRPDGVTFWVEFNRVRE